MFKSALWRSDKNKIKAVFKLQFHATQVAQLGENALVISVVPGDVGKPTVRLDKAVIQDGCCRWASPVFETVKFVKEAKTGKISEKKYTFVVSTGFLKSGLVGEVSIDLADYAEATKVSTISLPLKNSRSKAVLHISIQKVQENDDQREIEESENLNVKFQDRSLRTQLSNGDSEEHIKSDSVEDKPPLSKTPLNALLSGNGRGSIGSDITLSSSESGSGLNTPREVGIRENGNNQDPNGFLLSLTHTSLHPKPAENAPATTYEEHQRSQSEWSGSSDQGISTDESINESQEAERTQQASDIEIEKLKSELIALARQADVSGLELQTLRKQIVKESKRGHDLTKEVTSLKEERDVLAAECEKLKSFHKRMDDAKVKSMMQFEGGDPMVLLEEIRQELNYERDLNANLRLQLQKTQESNSELILAVQDLEEMLDHKNKETSNISNESGYHESSDGVKRNLVSETSDDEEQKALEELVKQHSGAKETYLLEQKIMDLYSEIEIYRRDKDDLEMQMEQLALDYEILKQENHDISYKLEQSQLQEQLKMQYECSSTFANVSELETQIENLENHLNEQSRELITSSATVKELQTHIKTLEEEMENRTRAYEADLGAVTLAKAEQQEKLEEAKQQHEKLENELKNRSKELSDSLATINELESHIQHLEEDMEKQAQDYEADLEAVTQAKVEQEQRAIRAEEALRVTRWKNANTAERIQEEFRRLSMQMASTFDANEKVAVIAIAEANELRMQKSHVEEMFKKANEELLRVRDSYESKLHQLSNQVNIKTKMLEESDDKSKQLEHQCKQEEEVSGSLSMEIQMLKSEIEKLRKNNSFLSEQSEQKESLRVELEQMKKLYKESEQLVQKGNMERNELMNKISLVKKEAEKSLEELQRLRHLKDDKEVNVEKLKVELETCKSQCNEMKNTLMEDEQEKEKLRKQVLHLKGELKKKEDALTGLEKKLKDTNRRSPVSDGTRTTTLRNNKSAVAPQTASKEIASLRERIKLLEGQIKLKETALETSTNSFLEKEKDLRIKIDELESRVEELSERCSSFCESSLKKIPEESTSAAEEKGHSNSKPSMEVSDMEDMLTELTWLKEKNKCMEMELKEMQERYSEISLKFAEVEGERQQLVMTVRNLKNSKKG